MDKKTEALKLAMETLEKIHAHPKSFWNCMDEITAIREALAEQSVQQQEPLAWLYNGKLHEIDPSDWATGTVTPLFPLAQQQKPVAWLYKDSWGALKLSNIMPPPVCAFPVYTSPQASKPWVSLTDEERRELRKRNQQHDAFAKAIDAALKEKNNG